MGVVVFQLSKTIVAKLFQLGMNLYWEGERNI
jgi:hypothetical protein